MKAEIGEPEKTLIPRQRLGKQVPAEKNTQTTKKDCRFYATAR
jgi:hypothetical protein